MCNHKPLSGNGSAKEAPVKCLGDLMMRSTKKSSYFVKDLAKARQATQFIGEGSASSSTTAYAIALAPFANTGDYSSDDVIFISAEGDRLNRFNPIEITPNGAYRNIDRAIVAGASFIIDPPTHRNRAYNIGERQIASYLTARGYRETSPGLFTPPPSPRLPKRDL